MVTSIYQPLNSDSSTWEEPESPDSRSKSVKQPPKRHYLVLKVVLTNIPF